jgi:hypothetical protein
MPRWAVNPHNLTPEAAARGRAKQTLTRKWYKATLLAIFRGEIKCSSVQLTALKTFADSRGWFPPKRPKEHAIAEKRSRIKPQANDDVLQRLVAFNVAAIPDLQSKQNVAKQGN